MRGCIRACDAAGLTVIGCAGDTLLASDRVVLTWRFARIRIFM
jgi:hypothetical protein